MLLGRDLAGAPCLPRGGVLNVWATLALGKGAFFFFLNLVCILLTLPESCLWQLAFWRSFANLLEETLNDSPSPIPTDLGWSFD